MNTTEYDKLRLTLKSQLIGMATLDSRYNTCIEAFAFAEGVHNGFRKDGTTREFYHQLSILGYLMTLHHSLDEPHLVYQVALLHDAYEDYMNFSADLQSKFPEAFPYIQRISKVDTEGPINIVAYYHNMSTCSVTSIVKAVDRIHNLSTMTGIFSEDKISRYKEEVDTYFLPMIKRARRMFPSQTAAYENLKCVLNLLRY